MKSSHVSKLGTRNSKLGTFSWPVRVYYEDTDLGEVVYYANYLARDHGVVFVVSSLTIDFLRPAAFNDELTVTVELERLGAGQIIVTQTIARDARALAAARVRIGCVNTSTFRPVRIPLPVTARLGNRT